MRIISGTHRGKRLIAPKNLPVRPTTDMAKEGLFNILWHQYDLEEISVLDLFSGTGNISFEFASRGCLNITAVDANTNCTRYISKIATQLEFPIQVLKADVYKFLERNSIAYDIIFADPPYDIATERLEAMVQLIFSRELLNKNGLLIVEHPPQQDLSNDKHFKQQRKYGSSVFSFFENIT
ncbi:MAG: RsmD family RNA methyltransferase [Bacteroidota bacterium]